mmetsp:Transcript_914/g.2667  ORF Transcript_914/g.2667 Transcript_914/m.2667 type:complete len:85 (+) Transcript_914:331-585(+)
MGVELVFRQRSFTVAHHSASARAKWLCTSTNTSKHQFYFMNTTLLKEQQQQKKGFFFSRVRHSGLHPASETKVDDARLLPPPRG